MKIGIDISQIVYYGSGVARFTQGLVEAILKYDRKNRWYFFFFSFRRKLDPDLEDKISKSPHCLYKFLLPPTITNFLFNELHNFSRFLTFNFKTLTSLDWFVTSDWVEPPLPTKKATIVHDLVFKRYPETMDPKIKKTQEKRLSFVKNESKIIFADSKTTKDDLVNYLKINPKKIIVNYPGIEIYSPTKNTIENVLKKFNLTEKKFILTVSKLEPRKNLERLIEAFKKLKNSSINLIIVGQYGWGKKINVKLIPPNIKFLGYVTDTELYSLYSACLFFIFPSIWEGFGYPLVEAMLLKTPIVCSNTQPIKEITGNAAFFFDPFNIDDIADKIDQMLKNEKLRKELIKMGNIRGKIFSWGNYYKKFIKVLESFN